MTVSLTRAPADIGSMPLAETVTRALVVVALAGAVGYVWHLEGRGRWYDRLTDRLLYGVPWGTLVSVAGVVAFYLFAQSGLGHWDDPVTVAFRSWSYSYLPGMVVSGFAHASPNHLTGNLVATVVLAPLAEFAWSHYPPPDSTGGDDSADAYRYRYPPPSEPTDPGDPTEQSVAADDEGAAAAGGDGNDGGRLLSRPWVRAFVAFPAVVFLVSVVTSVFALGWSLGFSGTVFAFGGFVVVVLPLTSVVAMLGIGGVAVVYQTLTEPILRVTADPGAPGPPAWAGVNVQAHLLGFLLGVVLGLALLHARERRPAVARVFLAALVFGLARRLWLLPWSSDDTFIQYRGIGLVLVLVLTTLITAAAAAADRPLVPPDSSLARVGRLFAGLWLAVATAAAAAAGFASGWDPAVTLPAVAIIAVLSLPALLPFLPDERYESPVSRRATLLAGLVLVTGAMAAPSIAGNLPGMDEDPVPEGAVAVEDYRVVYAENASHGRIDSTDSGVIVVSERRDVWTTAVSKQALAHEGSELVAVGGVGWRAAVTAERRGWEVVGNSSVYAVDLEVHGERTRSFTSPGRLANARIDNHSIRLTPAGDGFRVAVARNGTAVGEAPIPGRDESVTVGPIQFVVEPDGDTASLLVTADGTRVEVARRETF
jgi:hypothetical protein